MRNERSPSALSEPALALEESGRQEQPVRARSLEELEERVRRLEEQYAALKDTRIIEERVVQRVARRLRRNPGTAIREAGVIVADQESAASLPVSFELPSSRGAAPAVVLDVPALPAPAQAEQPPAPLARPLDVPVAKPLAEQPQAASPAVAQPGWLSRLVGPRFGQLLQSLWLLELLNELRVMLRMFVDPRYQLTWSGRLVPLLFLALYILPDVLPLTLLWLLPWTWIPGLNKVLVLVVGYITFKVLIREARRYQEMIPDAPRTPVG